MPAPWYRSMACAVGLCINVLNKIDEYARKYNALSCLEVLYNTIAMNNT
jgi:hypothetical protein